MKNITDLSSSHAVDANGGTGWMGPQAFHHYFGNPTTMKCLGAVVGLQFEPRQVDAAEVTSVDILCRRTVASERVVITPWSEFEIGDSYSHLDRLAEIGVDILIWVSSGFREKELAIISQLDADTGRSLRISAVQFDLSPTGEDGQIQLELVSGMGSGRSDDTTDDTKAL